MRRVENHSWALDVLSDMSNYFRKHHLHFEAREIELMRNMIEKRLGGTTQLRRQWDAGDLFNSIRMLGRGK